MPLIFKSKALLFGSLDPYIVPMYPYISPYSPFERTLLLGSLDPEDQALVTLKIVKKYLK